MSLVSSSWLPLRATEVSKRRATPPLPELQIECHFPFRKLRATFVFLWVAEKECRNAGTHFERQSEFRLECQGRAETVRGLTSGGRGSIVWSGREGRCQGSPGSRPASDTSPLWLCGGPRVCGGAEPKRRVTQAPRPATATHRHLPLALRPRMATEYSPL